MASVRMEKPFRDSSCRHPIFRRIGLVFINGDLVFEGIRGKSVAVLIWLLFFLPIFFVIEGLTRNGSEIAGYSFWPTVFLIWWCRRQAPNAQPDSGKLGQVRNILGKHPAFVYPVIFLVSGLIFVGINWSENQQLRRALQNAADAVKTPVTQPTVPSQPTQPIIDDTGHTTPHPPMGKAAEARFINEAVTLMKAQQADQDKLDQRIERLQLAAVLAPETLVDRGKIAQAQITTQKVLSLIAERQTLVANQWEVSEARLKSIPNDDDRRRALEPFNKNKAKYVPLFQQRDNTQKEIAETFLAVLKWADSNVGSTVTQNGQLLIQNQELLDQYNNYIQRIQALAEKESRLVQAITEARQARQKEIQRLLDEQGIH